MPFGGRNKGAGDKSTDCTGKRCFFFIKLESNNVKWLKWRMANRPESLREREKKAFIRVRRKRLEQNRCVCECTFCTQNVRMIYFHIWFVCASSSNVIHFRWNFLCTATSTSAHFLYRAQSTMKPFTVCQGTYSYSVLCCCCLVFFSSFHCSLPHNLNLFGFLQVLFIHTLCFSTNHPKDQIFDQTDYCYFSIYLQS